MADSFFPKLVVKAKMGKWAGGEKGLPAWPWDMVNAQDTC